MYLKFRNDNKSETELLIDKVLEKTTECFRKEQEKEQYCLEQRIQQHHVPRRRFKEMLLTLESSKYCIEIINSSISPKNMAILNKVG